MKRRVAGYFAEARWSPSERIFITGGVRLEDIERDAVAPLDDAFSPRPAMPADSLVSVNPRVAGSYYIRAAPGTQTRVRGAAGTGIKPPDGFDIAFTDNPSLKPERSRSVETGVDQSFAAGRGLVEATYFWNTFDDLIVAVGRFAGSSRYRTDNISNARARGLELATTLRHRAAGVDLQARVTYTFLDSEILNVDKAGSAPPPFETGQPLLQRPRHQWAMDATASHGRWTAWTRGGGRGRVLAVEPSFGTFGGLFDAAGYAVWNAGVSARVTRQLELFGGSRTCSTDRTRRSTGSPPSPAGSWQDCGLLQAADVFFSYGSAAVLRGVTMEVPANGFVGILGPNGSGKTTLLRVLAGLLRPASGRVLLDHDDIAQASRPALARRMAVVPQETHLAFDYSVLEVVLMGRYPHLGTLEIEGPADFAIARESLAATGTLALEHRGFGTLSGGEKQRVIIAAALAQIAGAAEDRLLLLDEPTVALDLSYQLELAGLLIELQRRMPMAIAVSTHDLNFAASVCRTLVLLKGGVVLAAGPTREVLTPANIRALYGVEADVTHHAASGRLVVIPIHRVADGSGR